jgi:hypothetical protein
MEYHHKAQVSKAMREKAPEDRIEGER